MKKFRTLNRTTDTDNAVALINNEEKLDTLSVDQLIALKATLYTGKASVDKDELNSLVDEWRDMLSIPLKPEGQMSDDERTVSDGLAKLDTYARARMKSIYTGYKNKKPVEKYKNMVNLSFAFRNDGRNPERFSENKRMFVEHSKYTFQKRAAARATTGEKVLDSISEKATKLVNKSLKSKVGQFFHNVRNKIAENLPWNKKETRPTPKLVRAENFAQGVIDTTRIIRNVAAGVAVVAAGNHVVNNIEPATTLADTSAAGHGFLYDVKANKVADNATAYQATAEDFASQGTKWEKVSNIKDNVKHKNLHDLMKSKKSRNA